MRRTAILIEAARVKGQRHLPGAEADVEHFTKYLTSVSGGAWRRDEIITMSKPPSPQLFSEIRKAEASSDYLFISFSGHGYMKAQPQNAYIPVSENQLTMLCLNDNEEISVSQINPSIKNFLFVDSCREIEKILASKMEEDLYRSFAEDFRKDRARQLFDAAVLNAGPGQILAYSCGINETAGEDPNRGGYFSAAMIESGIALSGGGTSRGITIEEVYESAFNVVKKQASQQNPQYRPGRRQRHFPFAVRV